MCPLVVTEAGAGVKSQVNTGALVDSLVKKSEKKAAGCVGDISSGGEATAGIKRGREMSPDRSKMVPGVGYVETAGDGAMGLDLGDRSTERTIKRCEMNVLE